MAVGAFLNLRKIAKGLLDTDSVATTSAKALHNWEWRPVLWMLDCLVLLKRGRKTRTDVQLCFVYTVD